MLTLADCGVSISVSERKRNGKKVKFTLEQTTNAQRASRGISLLFKLGARQR
jgi:hypothetical protein